MTPPEALRVDAVTVRYANGHTALRDATFALPANSIAALVGMNGAGKSTLFKALTGSVPLAAGRIAILGDPVARALRRGVVSYVPQAEEVDWTFPVLVEDVVMMGRYGQMNALRWPRASDRAAVTEALERVGLAHLRHRQIGELSGGQRKRVFLARALAQEGRVILLDEPFAGVDMQTEETLIDLLRQMRDTGCTILVATHDLAALPRFCDRAVLVRGTVLAHGPTAQVFVRANLEATFGGQLPPAMTDQDRLLAAQ